jgi:hypothetical protein
VLDGSGESVLDDPIDRGLDVGHMACLRASRLVGEVHLERDPQARLVRKALDERFEAGPNAQLDEIERRDDADGVAGRLVRLVSLRHRKLGSVRGPSGRSAERLP